MFIKIKIKTGPEIIVNTSQIVSLSKSRAEDNKWMLFTSMSDGNSFFELDSLTADALIRYLKPTSI